MLIPRFIINLVQFDFTAEAQRAQRECKFSLALRGRQRKNISRFALIVISCDRLLFIRYHQTVFKRYDTNISIFCPEGMLFLVCPLSQGQTKRKNQLCALCVFAVKIFQQLLH